jgi:hypothetical protein
VAAWRVLRGEWVARPPVAANHAYTDAPTTGSAAYVVDWKVGHR